MTKILFNMHIGILVNYNMVVKKFSIFQFKFQTEEENAQLDKSSRTLQIRLSDMSQLIVSFSYCFENEMRHWCNKTPPVLTDLGVAFKRVYNLLQQFVAVCFNSPKTIFCIFQKNPLFTIYVLNL